MAASARNDDHAIDVASLTRGLVRGDESAYRDFHRLYFDRLHRYLLVVASGNEDTAREALQTAYTRVVRHIRKFDDEEIFWSWLTVLARTAFFDQSRKRRRYFAFLDRFAREPQGTALADTPTAEQQLENALANSLAQLPPEDQCLLAWKYTEDRSVRSIASELLITDKAVESRLSRLRKKLKEILLNELKRHEAS